MRRKIEIELFGRKYYLFELNAIEYASIPAYDESKANDVIYNLYYRCELLSKALRYNYCELPFYKLFRKLRLKKLFSVKSIASLPSSELKRLAELYDEFEGFDKKKEMTE
ncbi:MAG: hypothetical protein JRJ62_04785 [Deltaproteobacteria bacterium]|nr:hypothetical protein [Deltaproteobacteria bacterium]